METRPVLRTVMRRVCSLPRATSPKSSVAGATESMPPKARTLDWLAPPQAAATSTPANARRPIRHPQRRRRSADGHLHAPCQGAGQRAGAWGVGNPLPSHGSRCPGGLQRFAHDGRVVRPRRRPRPRRPPARESPRVAEDGVVAAADPTRHLRVLRPDRAARDADHGSHRPGRPRGAECEGQRRRGLQGMQHPQEADDPRGAGHDEASAPARRGLMPLSEKDFPVEERSLDNGLQIRLLPDTSLPVCTLYSFFRVGSRNERPGITGISHLFEHMMFNGSKKYGPKEFDRRLEAAGGTSNAYTSNDLTAYYEDFASEALPLVLDLEADRMASLLIDDASLDRERDVVKEERRLVIRYPSQAPAMLAGFRGPSGRDPDSLVLDLIEAALSAGEGARLKRALVYEQELCVDAHVYFAWRMDPGLFEISLKLNPGVDPDRAEGALWAELARVSDEVMSDRELDRAKNLVRSQLLRSLSTTNGS